MEFDVDIDTTHACDTQQQVERFVALFEGDVGAALRAVNDTNSYYFLHSTIPTPI